jgi:hypothetical protein
MALSPATTHHRARIAALSRDRQPHDPELVEARRTLRGIRLEERVSEVLAGWPPLTDEQLDRVAALLRAGSRGGDHAA